MADKYLARIFAKIPVLETSRLLLRKMVPSDYTDMYEYACKPSVTEYLLWDPHPNPSFTYRYLLGLQSQYRSGDFFDWGLILKSENKFIGSCGFTTLDLHHRRGEVGYVLNPFYWGQGLVPEALTAVMAFGFHSLGLHRLEAHYIMGNDRSRRVMEKCGMQFEGVLRDYMEIKGQFRDIGFCSILKPEFDARFGSTQPT